VQELCSVSSEVEWRTIICGVSNGCVSVRKSHLGDFIAGVQYGCDICNKM
jgi:hypothetical protein